MDFRRMTRKFLLGEANPPSLASYIQSVSEVLQAITPRSRTDERRIEMAKSSLKEVRRHSRRLQERVDVLEEQVKILEESEKDPTEILKEAAPKYRIERSEIDGVGVFASKNISENENIGTIIDHSNVTGWAQKINHQSDSNTKSVKRGNNYALVAIKPIPEGTEITANYKTMPDGTFNFSTGPDLIDKDTSGFVEK